MQVFNNNDGSTASSYWQESAFSFKFYLALTCLLFLLSFIFNSITQTLVDIPYFTAFEYELWRLFFSLFVLPPKLMSILGIVFAFVWLHRLIKDTERGTVYKIIEVLLINFEVHLLFNVISYPFVAFFESSMESPYFYGYFWFKVIIVYEFRESVRKPDDQRKFCFLPFTIKGKHYPYLIVVMTAAMSEQLLCTIAATLLGLFQEVYKKQMLIRLPFGVYNCMQKILPAIVKERPDFVLIKDRTNELLQYCWGAGSLPEDVRNLEEANLKSRYIFNASDGVPLDNRNKLIVNEQQEEEKRKKHFKDHWALKEAPTSTQATSENSQGTTSKQKAWQSRIDPKILQAPQIPEEFKMKLAYLQEEYKEQQKNNNQQNETEHQEEEEEQQVEESNEVFNKKGKKKASSKKIAQQDDQQIEMEFR